MKGAWFGCIDKGSQVASCVELNIPVMLRRVTLMTGLQKSVSYRLTDKVIDTTKSLPNTSAMLSNRCRKERLTSSGIP